MKKMIFLLVFAFMCAGVFAAEAAPVSTPAASTPTAQAEETLIVYDVYKHIDTASNIFLGIGGLSLGIGTGIMANAGNNQLSFGIGVQTLVWGAVETCLFLYDKNFIKQEEDEKKAIQQFKDRSGLHAIFDLAYIVAGGCLALFGDDSIKGHGMGIMIQGGILAAYDGVNFFIASNPEDVKDWGAGVKYNIKFANID